MIALRSPFTECPPPCRCLGRTARKETLLLRKERRFPWDSIELVILPRQGKFFKSVFLIYTC